MKDTRCGFEDMLYPLSYSSSEFEVPRSCSYMCIERALVTVNMGETHRGQIFNAQRSTFRDIFYRLKKEKPAGNKTLLSREERPNSHLVCVQYWESVRSVSWTTITLLPVLEHLYVQATNSFQPKSWQKKNHLR